MIWHNIINIIYTIYTQHLLHCSIQRKILFNGLVTNCSIKQSTATVQCYKLNFDGTTPQYLVVSVHWIFHCSGLYIELCCLLWDGRVMLFSTSYSCCVIKFKAMQTSATIQCNIKLCSFYQLLQHPDSVVDYQLATTCHWAHWKMKWPDHTSQDNTRPNPTRQDQTTKDNTKPNQTKPNQAIECHALERIQTHRFSQENSDLFNIGVNYHIFKDSTIS